MKTSTHPIIAVLAGVTPAPAPCPCNKTRAAGLGFALQDTSGAESIAPLDTAGGTDWHWLVIAALAGFTAYAMWPKPARELRNVRRREAARSFAQRLEQIDRAPGDPKRKRR